MKISALACMGAAALALGACVPPNAHRGHARLTPVSRLDCPDSEGVLKRVSAAGDGKSCSYVTDGGAQVDLKLTPVSGDANAVLDAEEAELKTIMPMSGDAETTKPATPASAAPASDGDKGRDHVNINLPGVSIHADDGKANIHVGGIHIDADDKTDTVHMHGGHGRGGRFTIDANNEGAIIRARGGGPDIKASLILASDKTGPQGWRVVGYEALGPQDGPIVLATVKSKGDQHDPVFNDVKTLVRRAAGVRGGWPGIHID